MIELEALILTFNERENIGRTIAALSWAKQIVIFDSFSTVGPHARCGLRTLSRVKQ